MIKFVVFVCLVLYANAVASNDDFHFMESHKPRRTFEKKHRANGETTHEVLIALQKKNMPEFQAMVIERATPGSRNYQNWFKYDEVTELVKNPEAFDHVKHWLTNHGITVNWISRRQDYIRAEAPIKKWEELLNAEFYVFLDHSYRLGSGQPELEPTTYLRCLSYSIPKQLKSDVQAIFHTVQAPIAYHKSFYMKEAHPTKGFPFKTKLRLNPSLMNQDIELLGSGGTTVSYLNSYYKISSNIGSSTLNQSVFETSNEYFSPNDLTQFQTSNGLTVQSAISIGGHTLTACPTTQVSPYSCTEGNLDIQYIMGIAQVTSSIFWYVPTKSGVDSFVTWLTDIVDDSNPPQSNSMSWGSVEQDVSGSTLSQFDTEASILAGMGVTILISSGDNGVANSGCSCTENSGSNAPGTEWNYGGSWSGNGYFPSFPASNSWVTAVGATMGSNGAAPAVGTSEIACQSQLGGVITTGGGFSTYYVMPSWQVDAVSYYFSHVAASPNPGYNPAGRAYPDISYCGVDYPVVIGGKVYSIYGTSASAPVFAAMITLINTIRQSYGRPMIGFLNPTLYSVGYNTTLGMPSQYGSNATFNDVTSGDNSCCAYSGPNPLSATCCGSGFEAAIGWDPVTGWGSMNLPDLAQVFEVAAPYTPSDGSNGNNSGKNSVVALAIGLVILLVVIFAAGSIVYCCCCRPKPPLSQQSNSGNPTSRNSRSVNQPVPATVVQIATPQVVQMQPQYQQNPAYKG